MKINFVKTSSRAKKPTQGKPHDAAYDLYSIEDVTLAPGERRAVRTGIQMEIPNGYHGRILPKSGLARDKGLDVMAGVIDAGFRDEILVVLINLDIRSHLQLEMFHQNEDAFMPKRGYMIKSGQKIAQIRISKQEDVEWVETNKLSISERNLGGFGHTGS